MTRQQLTDMEFKWEMKLFRLREQFSKAETDDERKGLDEQITAVQKHLERIGRHL